MLKGLGDYVNILVIVSIIASILMTIAPKGSSKAIIGVVSGAAIIFILLKPLASFSKLDFNTLIGQFSAEMTDGKNNFTQSDLLKELIADKTSAYILAKARALGLDCKVVVTVGGENVPTPQTVDITGEIAPNESAQRELAAFLSFDCGIPEENQRFIWKK